MRIDAIYFAGTWWLDTDQAALMLGISPASLRRNRDVCSDLRTIDCTRWHRACLWRLDDVMRVSQARMQAATAFLEASKIAGDFAR